MENSFIDQLRVDLVVDRVGFDRLQSDLKALSIVLRGRRSVDRRLMQYLYPMAQMVWNTAAAMPTGEGLSDELNEMATVLDALVTECLGD